MPKKGRLQNMTLEERKQELEKMGERTSKKVQQTMAAMYKLSKADGRKMVQCPEQLNDEIDNYIDFCSETGLFPTVNGLQMYMGVNDMWVYSHIVAGDEYGEILERFQRFVSEVMNQSGLAGESDRVFTIYYAKSKLKEYDTPSEMTINVNQMQKSNQDFLEVLENTPTIEYIDVENYKE